MEYKLKMPNTLRWGMAAVTSLCALGYVLIVAEREYQHWYLWIPFVFLLGVITALVAERKPAPLTGRLRDAAIALFSFNLAVFLSIGFRRGFDFTTQLAIAALAVVLGKLLWRSDHKSA